MPITSENPATPSWKKLLALGLFLFGVVIGMWGQYQHHWMTRLFPPPKPQPSQPIAITAPPNVLLFALVGQSNMVGFAPVPQNYPTSKHILLFANNYRWQLARPPLDSPNGQVDEVSRDPGAGFGPGLPFAAAWLSQHPRTKVGLIPCAKNGSSLYQWRPSKSDQTLYGSCLKRLRAASVTGKLAGILFFQGESDALPPEVYPQRRPSPATWKRRFVSWVQAIRHDLQRPHLPLVFAQIGTPPSDRKRFPGWLTVQKQQALVKLPFVRMIRTEGLPLQDGLHFTQRGYTKVGQRFAQALVELLRQPK
ncbi:MAG: sialate O-acetylesterase [Deltaproteobacteria bacterium]|nr:MAG: sialate O-acetylesterase [Deltaproteobacteria bacterium]